MVRVFIPKEQISSIYCIVSGEISVYLMKIKVVSIAGNIISYHFTNDLYDLIFHSSLWMTSVIFYFLFIFLFHCFKADGTSASDF